MVLRALAISSNEGLSDGSSAQHCFIRVKTPGCTSHSPSFDCGRQYGVCPALILWISTAQNYAQQQHYPYIKYKNLPVSERLSHISKTAEIFFSERLTERTDGSYKAHVMCSRFNVFILCYTFNFGIIAIARVWDKIIAYLINDDEKKCTDKSKKKYYISDRKYRRSTASLCRWSPAGW